MTTHIGASVFVDPSQIRHDITNGNPTITFGPYPTVNRVDVYLGDRATIHAVIAHLVALEQEMLPPVITDSGRTCDQANPGTGAWCHRDGEHQTHRDTNGDEWRTDAATEFTSTSLPGRVVARCQDPGFHHPNLTGAVVDCDQPEHHAPGDGGVLLPAGCDPDMAARGELCHYCDVEPATVTLTNGRYCEACAPGVQLATGADVAEPATVTEFTSDSRLTTVARCTQPREHHNNLAGAVVECDRAEHHAPADRILDVEAPAPAGTWCTASTVRDGVTVYCDVKGPHADHRGPGRDECCEVVWSDEPASVTA